MPIVTFTTSSVLFSQDFGRIRLTKYQRILPSYGDMFHSGWHGRQSVCLIGATFNHRTQPSRNHNIFLTIISRSTEPKIKIPPLPSPPSSMLQPVPPPRSRTRLPRNPLLPSLPLPPPCSVSQEVRGQWSKRLRRATNGYAPPSPHTATAMHDGEHPPPSPSVYMVRHPRRSYIVYPLPSLEVASPKNKPINSTLSSNSRKSTSQAVLSS